MEQVLLATLLMLICMPLICCSLLDQATFLKSFLTGREYKLDDEWALSYVDMKTEEDDLGSVESDLIKDNLPGQQSKIGFKHYAGYVTVDNLKGRSLFYYFVESALSDPVSKSVVLWLNEGPGCSSIGIGAFVEHGPFGVQSDGTTLYLRHYSWNKESPAGVGFSYSNTTADYNTTGDLRTARDSYVFLINWFRRFSQFKNSDFYIAGESYAGFYIPELTQLIVQKNRHAHPSAKIQLKGVMIGNGMMDFQNTRRGIYEYHWSHGLISDYTYQGLIRNCIGLKFGCLEFEEKATEETGNINISDISSENCDSTSPIKGKRDEFLRFDLNSRWKDRPASTLSLYKNLISSKIRILVYSGDMDGVIPFTSTKFSLKAMNLTEKSPWMPWLDDREKVAGYRVNCEGLTFMTVLGVGHEVPRVKPRKAFSLIKLFLEGL